MAVRELRWLWEANSRLSVPTTAAPLGGHPAGGVLVGVVGAPWARRQRPAGGVPAGADRADVATSRTLTWGVIPLGARLGGAAGTPVGTRAALVAVGVACAVPLLLALASPLRSVRDLESAEIQVAAGQ